MIQNGRSQKLSFARLAHAFVAVAGSIAICGSPAKALAKKAPEEKAKVVISGGTVVPAQGLAGDTFTFSATISASKAVKDLDVRMRVSASGKVTVPAASVLVSAVTLKAGESRTFTLQQRTMEARAFTYSLNVTVSDSSKGGEILAEGVASAVTVTAPPPMNSVGITLLNGGRLTPIYPGDAQLDYYKGFGMNIVRLPFRWEEMQPVPFGELDAAQLSRIRQLVNGAFLRGMRIVLVADNRGRHRGMMLGTADLPSSALGDLWQRVAREFRDDPAVYGLQIMSKPEVVAGTWPAIAQETVDTIRRYRGSQMIFVDGECRSEARVWAECNAGLNIRDPLNKIAYSASQFLDTYGRGLYRDGYDFDGSYELQGAEYVQPFLDWAQARGARAVIAEFGLPWDDSRYVDLLNAYLASTVPQCAITIMHFGGPETGTQRTSLEPLIDPETGIVTEKALLTSKIDTTMPQSCLAGW